MNVLSIIIPSSQEFDSTINKILHGFKYLHLKISILDFILRIKDGISKWIVSVLKKLFFNIPSPGAVSDNLSNIFLIIGFLLIFTIVVLIVVKVSKTFERKKRINEILGEKIDDKTTPNSLRILAMSFVAKEDFRQAIRYDFIAILLLMHEKNIVYLDETKTNEEIYKYLKKNNFFMLSVFECLVNDFNSSWYGHRLCNKGTYDLTVQNINLLFNEVLIYEEKK
ncbi:hypothetical protein [Clostridium sp.]|uniref:hypothetical protein n=1 Tax=Clostridium sp. TaxID=1506 RepID=UPI003D6D842E